MFDLKRTLEATRTSFGSAEPLTLRFPSALDPALPLSLHLLVLSLLLLCSAIGSAFSSPSAGPHFLLLLVDNFYSRAEHYTSSNRRHVQDCICIVRGYCGM